MEVAGRWRREWAGAAEYGKVARDGVVVRTTRALEVVQASGPGARMRVTRSAFHSQGPLSSTFLLHSSTRTILSSGADVLLSPSLVSSKPLELSSTPLEAASDEGEGEPSYRVTEPDDTDISEPSKWRASGARRGPSDDSSSTDNASLVDAAGRPYFSVAETPARASFHRKSAGAPLMKISEHARCLESSVAKSTGGQARDEWHDRRNSYGFEDPPPNEIKGLSENDKIGMESSTDSGICKSTEIVNIPIDKYKPYDVEEQGEEGSKENDKQETFRDWLVKNRSMNTSKADFSSTRRNVHDSNVNGSRINVKSHGKISIAISPSSNCDSEDSGESNKKIIQVSNENTDRRLKKVGFSKTELHFTAESGKVKIIETDDKPPPTNDFRKRRNVFEPIKDKNERPITLFGGASHTIESSISDSLHFDNKDNINFLDRLKIEQETDAAMKSILKNKIPKPKPYLLGEDVDRGASSISEDSIWGVRSHRTSEDKEDTDAIKSKISVLNESLKEENRFNKQHVKEQPFQIIATTPTDAHHTTISSREWNSTPVDYVNLSDAQKDMKPLKNVASTQTPDEFIFGSSDSIHKHIIHAIAKENNGLINDLNVTNSVHEKMKLLQLSPVLQNRMKTRHLRQNELSYFGVTTSGSDKPVASKHSLKDTIPKLGDMPQQQTTKNKRTSNRDAKEPPLYQNLPVQYLAGPVPAPRASARTREVITDTKRPAPGTQAAQYGKTVKSDDEVKERPSTPRKSKRVLETISELKVASQGSIGKSGHNHRSSPSVIRIDTRRSKSLSRSGSKESVERSRDSSAEDDARIAATAVVVSRPRRSRSVDQRPDSARTSNGGGASPHVSRHYARVHHQLSEDCTENNIRYAVLEKKPAKCSTISSRAIDLSPKTLNRSSSGREKNKNLQLIKSDEKKTNPKKNNENCEKEKHPKVKDKVYVEEKVIKQRQLHTKPEDHKEKHRSRKKEYILNYDDQNGTLSSISKEKNKHSSGRKHDKAVLAKIEERPKEKTRTSRITAMEIKNPMLPSHELPRHTKSSEHKTSRRKPKEESTSETVRVSRKH